MEVRMTRMSPHPCPYCGEHFELRLGPGTPKRHHVQNDWCRRQVELARVALANAKRSEDRRKKRDEKPFVSIPHTGILMAHSHETRRRHADRRSRAAPQLVNDLGLPRKRLTML
jgi:hypothetical protein